MHPEKYSRAVNETFCFLSSIPSSGIRLSLISPVDLGIFIFPITLSESDLGTRTTRRVTFQFRSMHQSPLSSLWFPRYHRQRIRDISIAPHLSWQRMRARVVQLARIALPVDHLFSVVTRRAALREPFFIPRNSDSDSRAVEMSRWNVRLRPQPAGTVFHGEKKVALEVGGLQNCSGRVDVVSVDVSPLVICAHAV